MSGKKIRNKPAVCRYCTRQFLAADVKATICDKCQTPRPCLCGCGGLATSAKHPWKQGHANNVAVARGHKLQAISMRTGRNKSGLYAKRLKKILKEYWDSLYGAERERRLTNNSFRENPNQSFNRRKDGFRSELEAQAASILKEEKVPYIYERCHWFDDGKKFYPDFLALIDREPILIEVSGFAYEAWRQAVVEKIDKIQANGYDVVCVTYDNEVSEMSRRVACPAYSLKEFRKWLHAPDG